MYLGGPIFLFHGSVGAGTVGMVSLLGVDCDTESGFVYIMCVRVFARMCCYSIIILHFMSLELKGSPKSCVIIPLCRI